MKTKWFWCFAILIALGLMSCTLFSQIQGAGNLSKPPSPSEGTPAGGAEVTPGTENAEQPVSGSGLLPNPAVGLDALSSYHQELSITFDGKQDGQPYTWTNSYTRDFWKDPAASFLLLKTGETGQAASERLVGSLGEAHYTRYKAGDPCQATWGPSAPGSGGGLEPAGMLLPVSSASEVGQEDVNGVSARHYQLSAAPNGGKASGDLWLAEDGGYVVRYQLTIQGNEKTFGKGISGAQKFEYELTQVNALADPKPPEGCPVMLTGFPVMDGAKNLRRSPNGVDYTSPARLEAISQFYQDQLKQQGWTLVAEHKANPQKPVLIFVNADQKQAATILLDGSEGRGVWVSVLLRAWEPAPTPEPTETDTP
jgi:hypothetical protein